MPYCGKCGAGIAEGIMFCSKCREPVPNQLNYIPIEKRMTPIVTIHNVEEKHYVIERVSKYKTTKRPFLMVCLNDHYILPNENIFTDDMNYYCPHCGQQLKIK